MFLILKLNDITLFKYLYILIFDIYDVKGFFVIYISKYKKVKIMLKIVVWFLTLQAIYRGKLQFVAEKKKKEWQNATSIAILMKS